MITNGMREPDHQRVPGRGRITRRRLFALAAGAGGALALGATTAAHATTTDAGTYLPPATGPWQTADPAENGWDVEALEAALELAGQRESESLIVVERGRILAERYWNGADASSAIDVASVQKSVVAMLFGVLASSTALRPADPVSTWLGPGWSAAGDAEAAITCRHLLTMTSGLDENLEFAAEPGTVWSYNTPAYGTLQQVLEAASGQSLQDFSSEALFARIGATAAWYTRSSPNNAEQGLLASARDLARLGLLMLAGGEWEGDRIIPLVWRDRMLEPSQNLNPAYGRLWWLNGQDSYLLPDDTAPRSGPLIPAAPADLAAALGAGGQKLYLVPSRHLVVIRLGDAPGGPRLGFDRDLWEALAPALPV